MSDLIKYIFDNNVSYKNLQSIDLELLSIFIENSLQEKIGIDARVKFKRRGNAGSMKKACIYIVYPKGFSKNIVHFQDETTVYIPDGVSEKEKEIIETSFDKWCNIIGFQNKKEENYEQN